MERNDIGSVWRRWDLHVHVPNTVLANDYGNREHPDYNKYFDLLYKSGISVVGLTDYFTTETIYDAIEAHDRYCREKNIVEKNRIFLIPNIEFRINDIINGSDEQIDVHVLLDPQRIDREEAKNFLTRLPTVSPKKSSSSSSSNDNELYVSNLTNEDKKKALISFERLVSELKNSYGSRFSLSSYKIIFPINGNGIRSNCDENKADKARRDVRSDDLDERADGFFGGPKNANFFLKEDRYENFEKGKKSAPKPVFSGSDSHSYDDIEQRVGKYLEHETTNRASYITWIRAEKSFKGLCQCFIEPESRVRIQTDSPETKNPDQVIDYIEFCQDERENKIFPDRIYFNPGINVIIGGRSSGKSTLLSYIAHSIDYQYVTRNGEESFTTSDGPAPGYSWDESVPSKVYWKNGQSVSKDNPAPNHVVYIPQNFLFDLSSRPVEVTNRLKEALRSSSPDAYVVWDDVVKQMEAYKKQINDLITEFFEDRSKYVYCFAEKQKLRNLADLNLEREALINKRNEILQRADFSGEDIANFDEMELRLIEIKSTIRALQEDRNYLNISDGDVFASSSSDFKIRLSLSSPDLGYISEITKGEIDAALNELRDSVQPLFVDKIRGRFQELESKYSRLLAESKELDEKLAPYHESKKDLGKLDEISNQVADLDRQIEQINSLDLQLKQYEENCNEKANQIRQSRKKLLALPDELDERWFDLDKDVRTVSEIEISLDFGFDEKDIETFSEMINLRSLSEFRKGDFIDLRWLDENLREFLEKALSGDYKLKKQVNPVDFCKFVCSVSKTVRLKGTLDEDSVGGFDRSTMTSGKQALFALKLILGSSESSWPLLLDQPEDDLDSRSIFESLVKELRFLRSKRQMFIVSHDANVAVGSDADCIIVANRHGKDSPNNDDLVFDYRTGGLESSKRLQGEEVNRLFQQSIEAVVCDVLDGGHAAFEKRARRYKVEYSMW